MNGNGNDIFQTNESGAGFASAATSPVLVGTEKATKKNLGMGGFNTTRFNPFGTVIDKTKSFKVLSDNKYRNYLMIQNNSSADIYIGFGVSLDVNTNSGFVLGAGGFYELDNNVPFNSIYLRGSALSQQVLIIEGGKDRGEK